jgi:TonB family protein
MMLKPKDETVAATPPGGTETTWVTFPKEFEKSFADVLDTRFTMILALTILLDCLSIAYLVSTASTAMSEKGTDRFRKKLAELVRDQAEMEREAKFIEALLLTNLPSEAESNRLHSARSSGARGRRMGGITAGENLSDGGNYTGTVSSGRRSREEISSVASRAGILGLLASNSGEAAGRAVEDVLSDNQAPMPNLDEALANSGALRRGAVKELGKPIGADGGLDGNGNAEGRKVRGGRSTNVGGIDAMVQGLGEGKAQGVQRSGGLEVGVNEPLIEEPSEDGKATGSRDRDAVAAVVAKHTSAIQFCYQREIKRNPNLKGKLVVRFVITPQGTIASVAILSSTLNNPTVESCIVERIKRWDDFGAIAPSKGNTTFRQVYTFGY